ncbi:MAG TPA: diacylglycerol kinase family protein [Myxococcota bacterium]|jgi:diacylglycerol kinase family enzyme|nr:diacylglycerol kinase family protein [Myxococcota bacterium]
MKSTRIVVIVNPRAAGGRAGRRWPALRAQVAERLGVAAADLEEKLTDAPGAATHLTRQALRDGADVVVALGGDGSVNEVLNGFFAAPGDDPAAPPLPLREGAIFAQLPFGTGGDFRKTLRLPADTLAAAEELGRLLGRAEPAPRLDVGRVWPAGGAPRLFVNIASCGQSGVVVEHTHHMPKALGGRLTFTIATLRAFFGWRNRPVRLRVDGGEPEEVVVNTLAVGNGRYFGAGMQVCPGADPLDGVFDVTVLGDIRLWGFITQSKRLYDGTVAQVPGVTLRRGRRIEAAPAGDDPTPVLIEVEGESAGRLPATFELFPAALPVLTSLTRPPR